ncbi:MAG: formyl transferase [Flavobacteriaceae bacterium]|nr:formyl transferase [Flavobacteriaceae bacterium]
MRIVIAGAVSSTLATLNQMIKHGMDVVGVLGYEPESIKNVSGYALLKPIAEDNNLPYKAFYKINDQAIIDQIQEWKPDLLFVVGLSQLVSDQIIQIPTNGVVGFHPTVLPKGRGRAPITWTVLNEKQGGANFFFIGDGVDNGPILEQELFDVSEDDYAEDIELKILEAIANALDRLLPRIKQGDITAIPQDDKKASYYGRRAPNDGLINWQTDANTIYSLIRASSKPHPGAITFKEDLKVIVWRAKLADKELNYTGVVGRILDANEEDHVLVQTGNGLLWITEYEAYDLEGNKLQQALKVGQKLGYYTDIELFKLKQEIDQLKKALK